MVKTEAMNTMATQHHMMQQMHVDEVLQRLEHTVNGYIQKLEQVSMEQLLWKPTPDEWSLGQMIVHLIQSAQAMQLANVRRCLVLEKQLVDELATQTSGKDTEATQADANIAQPQYVAKTAQGEALFQYGSFPQERIQVPPSPQYTPLQPDHKEQLVEGLQETLRQMMEVAPAVQVVQEQLMMDAVKNGMSAEEGEQATVPTATSSDNTASENVNLSIHATQEAIRNESEPSLPTVAHPRLGGLNAWEWFWLIEMHYRHHLHQQQRLEEGWEHAHA